MLRHPILWALDNEIDSRSFERLCTDLLFRCGYLDIVPVGGTNDAGRDAEIRHYRGNLPGGRPAVLFFQYSLEARWKAKLLKELNKVRANGHDIEAFVFVTSRHVRGDQRDKLREQVKAEYGWDLVIHEREWLRLQLEEAHPDLAAKYFGAVGVPSVHPSIAPKPEAKGEDAEHTAWRLFQKNDFDAAAVTFTQWLRSHSHDFRAWNALAWCHYQLARYGEALIAINNALALEPEDLSSLVVKASILTEDGILRSSRPLLVTARNIFERVMRSHPAWINHYNYGNVLSALDDFDAARKQYRKAIDLDPNQAIVWKNLSYVVGRLGDPDEEMRCLDRALALDPNKPEALVSKGIRFVHELATLSDGLQLLERALTVDPSISQRWHYIWYWLALAYHKSGKHVTALRRLDTGLASAPHDIALLNMKGQVLSALWREDQSHLAAAREFFLFRHEAVPEEGDTTAELARIHQASGQEEAAWELVNEFFALPHEVPASRCLRAAGCPLEDVLASARFLGSYASFRRKHGHKSLLDILNSGGIAADDLFVRQLLVIMSVSFGLGCQALLGIPRAERDYRAAERLYAELTQQLGCLVPRASALLASQVRRESVQILSDGIARIILASRNIALHEVSWQFGYIAGALGIPLSELEKIYPLGGRLDGWLASVTEATLLELNRLLKFAPE